MTQDNNKSQNLFLPIVLALLLVFVAFVVVWVMMIRPSTIGPQEAGEVAETQAEAAAAEVVRAPVDLAAATAAMNKGGCAACHTIPGLPGAVGQVGPNLSNIGVDGATRREGYTAEAYIRESLKEPNVFTAPECPTGPCAPGAMPQLQLNDAEIEALVSYLATLGTAEAEVAEAEPTEAAAPAEPDTITTAALEPIVEPSAPAEIVTAFNKGGCAGCHTIPGVPGANGQVGPNLSDIGVQAATRISGTGVEDYVRESIVDPNAFIAPECPLGECPEGVMLQSFAASLSQADLETIVNYLAVLGTDQAVPLVEAAAAPAAIEVSLPAESVLEPFIPLPKEAANEAQITLGKYLFFDARLSNNNSLSCASCHQPDKAFSDGEALSQGYPSTQYFRNVPSLYNTGYYDYLYWDGRMDGADMPTLVRDHLTEAHFMSNDGRLMVERLNQVPAYVELFDQAFGGGPSFGRTLNAVTAYVQTLNSAATPYDRYLAGDTAALSEEAQAGLALFEGEAGCSQCHGGDLLTGGSFYNIGVATDPAMFEDPERHVTFRRFFRTLGTPDFRNLRDDVGLYALTIDQEDWGKFRTPGLREVGRSAPYMHNGSLATLDEVVRFYNAGGGPDQTAGLQPLGLSEAEIGQLAAFLESLSSEPAAVEVPTLPDYQLLTLGGGN